MTFEMRGAQVKTIGLVVPEINRYRSYLMPGRVLPGAHPDSARRAEPVERRLDDSDRKRRSPDVGLAMASEGQNTQPVEQHASLGIMDCGIDRFDPPRGALQPVEKLDDRVDQLGADARQRHHGRKPGSRGKLEFR